LILLAIFWDIPGVWRVTGEFLKNLSKNI
jgi:hypothetical protein